MTPNDISKQNSIGLKFLDEEREEISEVSCSFMLFKEGKHLDETQTEDRTAEQQIFVLDVVIMLE